MGIKRGRIPGGVAILWNKRLDSMIDVVRLDVDWCIAVHVPQLDKECILLNVYTPYESNHNEDEYLNKLASVSSFLQNESFTSVM